MNIFRLHENPEIAAQLNNNSHVIKITTEVCQLLANLFPPAMLERKDCPRTKTNKVRKHSYVNHPLTKWLKESINNVLWIIDHGKALSQEYTFRYQKNHYSQKFIDWVAKNLNQIKLPNIPATEQPQCFSDFKHLIIPGNPVKGYRSYYKHAKSHLKKYKNRSVPKWY